MFRGVIDCLEMLERVFRRVRECGIDVFVQTSTSTTQSHLEAAVSGVLLMELSTSSSRRDKGVYQEQTASNVIMPTNEVNKLLDLHPSTSKHSLTPLNTL